MRGSITRANSERIAEGKSYFVASSRCSHSIETECGQACDSKNFRDILQLLEKCLADIWVFPDLMVKAHAYPSVISFDLHICLGTVMGFCEVLQSEKARTVLR